LAFYLIGNDELFIRANVKADIDTVRTVIHELGHRYEMKDMASKKRDIDHLYYILSNQERDDFGGMEKYAPKPGEKMTTKKGETYVVMGTELYSRGGPKVHLMLESDRKSGATISLEGWIATTQGMDKIRDLEGKPDYKGFVTNYAKKNASENFAEMFSFYCLGKLPALQKEPFEQLVFGR
jgi:hypothetical protein